MHLRQLHILLYCWYVLVPSLIFAQDQRIADSLSPIYHNTSLPDSAKLKLLQALSFNEVKDLRKGLKYAQELTGIAEKLGDKIYTRIGYFLQGTKYRMINEPDHALKAYIKSAEIAEELGSRERMQQSYCAIGDTYTTVKDFSNAHLYYNKAIALVQSSSTHTQNDSSNLATFILNKGEAFLKEKLYDSALLYSLDAEKIFGKLDYGLGVAYSKGNAGIAYAGLNKNEIAEENLNEAIDVVEKAQDFYPMCVYLLAKSNLAEKKRDGNNALQYALKSLQLAELNQLKEQASEASLRLSELYESSGDSRLSLKYFKEHIIYRDSVTNIPVIQSMNTQLKDYEVSQKQLELNLAKQQKRSQQNLLIALAAILVLVVAILGIILRNDAHKKKAYKALTLQKQKTEEQKERAENALSELQETQKQLIQSAKMASLGELTAGIAHEIQNPLNFVNNFSEISVELLDELRDVKDKNAANGLAIELDNNLKKIALHGKRAESIVKNMLQHSRMRSGQHELTDINALIEEFLHLSYSGIRAADKDFSASFETDLDSTIGKVDIIPQDIGRVFLNIFQNAFYAVDKRKKEGVPGYEPQVAVASRKLIDQNKLEIIISDNGTGIPEKVLDKIFQPFFTTKPTGQGTGLGLWLSYDIVKAHNGDINVESVEGKYTRLIIRLPIKT